MIRLPHNESPHDPGRRAFTLIEIVVALTIVAVIASVAIPTMKGLEREEKVSAPVRALAEMVQDVRYRAMHERRPYQIVFEREGIHACAFSFPQDRREDFLNHLKDLRTPPPVEELDRQTIVRTEIAEDDFSTTPGPKSAVGLTVEVDDPRAPPAFKMPWTQSIPLAPKSECSVLMWGDGEWDLIEGDEIRRWNFQPTGMASPAQVRLVLGPVELEAGFDPLTGELTRERSRRRPIEP